jgi:hypothetical protein
MTRFQPQGKGAHGSLRSGSRRDPALSCLGDPKNAQSLATALRIWGTLVELTVIRCDSRRRIRRAQGALSGASSTRSAGTFSQSGSVRPDRRRRARISDRSARSGTCLPYSGSSAAPTPTDTRKPRGEPAQRDPDQSQSALCAGYPSDLADRRRGFGRRGARLARAIGPAMPRIGPVRDRRAVGRQIWEWGSPRWERSCWCSISSVLLSSR